MQAYWEAEQDAEAKRQAKRQEQVLKRWSKLVQGLRIRQRLIEQYADRNVPATSAPSSKAGTAKADGHARDVDTGVDNQPADAVRAFSRLFGSVKFLLLDVATPHPTRVPSAALSL